MIGMGSEPAFFGIPGVEENGFTLWSLEDALKIKLHIKDIVKEASFERNKEKRKRMLTFVVAGSGFTGIEMAGELLEWKTTLAREYRVDKNEIRLLVVEAMSTILNMLDRKQADKAEKYMVKHGIELLKDSPITEVTNKSIKLKNATVIPTETLIWTCGIQANQDLNELEVETGQGNPQIVEAAEQTGTTAAKNIIASIENTQKVEFKPNYHGFMVSIGGKYGVASLMGMKLSGFFAMKERRCIMRGHLSSKGNRLWSVPLRLYIGCLWVVEGLKKLVGEGTWDSAFAAIRMVIRCNYFSFTGS
ncbi:MAG: FAD-dependent oxidoreductase [Romboutsia sp.]